MIHVTQNVAWTTGQIFSWWMQLYKNVVSSSIISYQDKTIKHSIFEKVELKRTLTPRKKFKKKPDIKCSSRRNTLSVYQYRSRSYNKWLLQIQVMLIRKSSDITLLLVKHFTYLIHVAAHWLVLLSLNSDCQSMTDLWPKELPLSPEFG